MFRHNFQCKYRDLQIIISRFVISRFIISYSISSIHSILYLTSSTCYPGAGWPLQHGRHVYLIATSTDKITLGVYCHLGIKSNSTLESVCSICRTTKVINLLFLLIFLFFIPQYFNSNLSLLAVLAMPAPQSSVL